MDQSSVHRKQGQLHHYHLNLYTFSRNVDWLKLFFLCVRTAHQLLNK